MRCASGVWGGNHVNIDYVSWWKYVLFVPCESGAETRQWCRRPVCRICRYCYCCCCCLRFNRRPIYKRLKVFQCYPVAVRRALAATSPTAASPNCQAFTVLMSRELLLPFLYFYNRYNTSCGVCVCVYARENATIETFKPKSWWQEVKVRPKIKLFFSSLLFNLNKFKTK